LSADGATLAVVGQGDEHASQFSTFRLEAATKTIAPLATGVSARATIYPSALSPDGRRLALGTYGSGAAHVYDTTTGRSVTGPKKAHSSPIWCMAFSPDGAKLATADERGTIYIWTADGTLGQTLKGHDGGVTAVRFSMDGKRLVTTCGDRTARVWDLENAGVAIRPVQRSVRVFARFSKDARLIAIVAGRGVWLLDAVTGQLVRELLTGPSPADVFSVAFSPTDPRLLAAGYGGPAGVSHVVLWDIASGEELARLPGATDLPDFPIVDEKTGPVGALAFSPMDDIWSPVSAPGSALPANVIPIP
jgi:WD40 repeat protein